MSRHISPQKNMFKLFYVLKLKHVVLHSESPVFFKVHLTLSFSQISDAYRPIAI